MLGYDPERSLEHSSSTTAPVYQTAPQLTPVAYDPNQKVSQQGAICAYTVTGEVPSFSFTRWHSTVVPLCLFIESSGGDAIGKIDVGQFTFVDGQNENSNQENSRKRKLSTDSADMQSAMKRTTDQYLRAKEDIVPQYNRFAGSYHGQQAGSLEVYPTFATASPPNIKAQSPQSGNWGSYQSSSMAHSPGVPSCLGLQLPGPHKAKLEIEGKLEEMAANWSEEEWDSGRRLVHFSRSQSGSTITTTFNAVSSNVPPSNSICISCIYWEEKQACFVTSVDIIYLLGKLLATQITEKERNRIPRNLQEFYPIAVSKENSDSEKFFKVIMAFPKPKPRNTEKNIKVFYWKDLASALDKIVRLYDQQDQHFFRQPARRGMLFKDLKRTTGREEIQT
ncbi:hypothetical protein IFR05_014262 [Cadophora sp. M221]|nr:hypothetical protein IFR05_014262 [Cadophora sp. M221]